MQIFSQPSVSPAVKSQLQAQFSFLSDVSNKMFSAVQQVSELNMQVAQTLMEESMNNVQQILSAKDQSEAFSVLAGQAQPAAEKLRAYQQHLNNIVAETQVNITKTAESHLPETTRAAEAIVREVAETASAEAEKATQRHKSAMEKLTNPISKQDKSSSSHRTTQ